MVPDKKTDGVLRAELKEWLTLTDDSVTTTFAGKFANPQNKKLALLGLNVVRDSKLGKNGKFGVCF